MSSVVRRSMARLRLDMPAHLQFTHGAHRVSLRNLSRTGACVVSLQPFIARGFALLTWDRFEAFGTVVWATEERCGLRFDVALALDVLAATRRIADAQDFLKPVEEARRAAEQFVKGFRIT